MKTKNLQLKDFFGATVWSYTRVSTKEQFMNNGSIETQVNRIKNFAKENALHIAEEFDAEYGTDREILVCYEYGLILIDASKEIYKIDIIEK